MFTALLVVIYLAYISLGLPDEIFGSAWPVMQTEMGVSLSSAGLFTMIAALCSVLSSFFSSGLIHRFGTAKITIVSISLTAIGLYGVSFSGSYWMVCLSAIPLGLGSGCIDAALNTFVALNFASRHMNWLHCSWGIGATTGPAVMSLFLNQTDGWRTGYRVIGSVQLAIAVIVLLSLPLWKKAVPQEFSKEKSEKKPVSYKSLIFTPGVKIALLAFLIYCGMEYLCGVWGAAYFVGAKGLAADTAARLVASFYLGITAGRLASGFLTMKVSDKGLIFLGGFLVIAGIAALLSPVRALSHAAFVILGLGCAPLYPCLMHSTPYFFGDENAPGVIGMQMSSAGLGGMLVPPFFGLLIGWAPISILPIFVLFLFLIIVICVARLFYLKQRERNL